MRTPIAFALVLALAACGSKQASPAQSCAGAAQHAIDAMVKQARDRVAAAQIPDSQRAAVDERTAKLEVMAPRMKAVLTNRCVDDKWKTDVIACFAKADALDAIRACRQQLTPEQQAKLQKDELDLLAAPTSGPPGFVQTGSAGSGGGIDPLRQEINEAMKAVVAAKTDAERTAAQATLDALRAKLTAQAKAQAHAQGSGSATDLAAMEAELTELTTQFETMQKALPDATDPMHRNALLGQIQANEGKRAVLRARIESAKAAATRQP